MLFVVFKESEEVSGKVFRQEGTKPSKRNKDNWKIVEEFNKRKKRDLSGLREAYLILDGIRLAVQAGTREKETVEVHKTQDGECT